MPASPLKVLEVAIDNIGLSEIIRGANRATGGLNQPHSRLPKIPLPVEPFASGDIRIGESGIGHLNHHLKSGKVVPQIESLGHGWGAQNCWAGMGTMSFKGRLGPAGLMGNNSVPVPGSY